MSYAGIHFENKVWIGKQNKMEQKTIGKKERSANSSLENVNRQGNLFSLLREKIDKGSDHNPNICTQESIFLLYPSHSFRQKHYLANCMISDFLGFRTET